MPRALYSSPPQAQAPRRVDHTRQLPPVGMDWRLAHGHYHQQLPPAQPSTQSDWLLPEELGSLKAEYGKHEYNTGAVGSEEPLRGAYVFQHQTPQAISHEVCVFSLAYFVYFHFREEGRIYPLRSSCMSYFPSLSVRIQPCLPRTFLYALLMLVLRPFLFFFVGVRAGCLVSLVFLFFRSIYVRVCVRLRPF
jgi:hypothetical protein